MRPLLEDIKLTKVADPAAAAITDVESTSLNMAGFDGVLFMTSYGTPAANNAIHAEHSDDDLTFEDIEGSEVDLGGASDEDQAIDIFRPTKPFVRCVGLRGTESTLGDIWAVQYRGRNAPNVNDLVGTIATNSLVSPISGTK